MLLGKFYVVVFREGRSSSGRPFKLWGWIFFVFLLALFASIGLNVWLGNEWLENRHAKEDSLAASRALNDQRQQVNAIRSRIDEIMSDVRRVQSFDTKIRIMMNMEKDAQDIGTSSSISSSFVRNYLPMHRQDLALRKIQEFLKELGESVRLEEVVQQDLLRALRENKETLVSMPTIWPTVGFISSRFGSRSSPFGGGQIQLHKGLDIGARSGTPIVATAEGTVRQSGRDGAYGNCVSIDHGAGIITRYAHMQRYIVQPGDWVKRGQVIGYVGSTGRSTGPHLHYEVILNGVPVNPQRYILE